MTVSVFICTYNRGNLIDGTLCAIIERQTRKPDEIDVVNVGVGATFTQFNITVTKIC